MISKLFLPGQSFMGVKCALCPTFYLILLLMAEPGAEAEQGKSDGLVNLGYVTLWSVKLTILLLRVMNLYKCRKSLF